MKRAYWFKAKSHGWGWYPSSWQGYVVLFLYVLLLGLVFVQTQKTAHSASDTLYGVLPELVLLTLILLAICFLTGERPRWSWGNR